MQDSGDPERPRWHWLLIGAGFTVTLWLPLAMLALWSGGVLSTMVGLSGARAWMAEALPIVLSFVLACFASSVLVGRFGGRAGRPEAVLANLLGSVGIVAVVGLSDQLPLAHAVSVLLVLSSCSLLSGWGGAALGIKLRPKIR